jgi:mobilization protein NikA
VYCHFYEKITIMTLSKKKTLPPFSFRLTPKERAQLEKDAAGMPLGAYIRSRLFDGKLPKRRTRNKAPVKDHQLLAKVLAEFQRSHLASNHNQIAKKVNTGSLAVTPDTEKAIQNGCADISKIRLYLMKALGFIEEKEDDPERLTTWWSQATGNPSFKGG